MFSYRALLKQSFAAAWQYKHLWLFGLFAAIVAGSGSWEYQLLTRNLNQNLIDGSYLFFSQFVSAVDLLKSFALGLVELFTYDFWTILNALTVLLLSIILIITFIWLAIVSQAALVDDAKKILNNKKKDIKLSIRESFTKVSPYFLPVLCLNITAKLLTTFIFVIISLPLLLMVINDTWLLATIYIILFVLFIPLSLAISLIIKYAIAYTVLEEKSLIASLNHAWRLFRDNWLVSVEMAIILFIINFLASGVIVIILSIFLLPLLLLGLMLQISWLANLIIFLAIILIVIFGSILVTFQIISWTKLFLSLKENNVLAKLERLFQR
ncbi:MAG: hypothetical protein WC863_03300 [Patescibacteria group bacterium]